MAITIHNLIWSITFIIGAADFWANVSIGLNAETSGLQVETNLSYKSKAHQTKSWADSSVLGKTIQSVPPKVLITINMFLFY